MRKVFVICFSIMVILAGTSSLLADDLTGTKWNWTSSRTPAGTMSVPTPANYTLDFKEGGVVAVKADCNTGSGTYKIAGNRLTFGPIAMTRMMCPPGSMDSQFLQGLGNSNTYRKTTAVLTIQLSGRGGSMTFARASNNPLLNTKWKWENTVTPVETIAPTVSAKYSLEFGVGRVNVRADCNTGSGTYKVQGNTITFGPIAMTRMMCPTGSLDTKFLQQLGAVRTFSVDGDKLMMDMTADGGTMHYSDFASASENPLTGSKWNWLNTKTANTTITPPIPANYSLSFVTNQLVAAQLDCNKANGTYAVSGNNISFGNMAATMMMCPPGSMGSAFSQQIGRARTFKIEGDNLYFYLENDAGTMTFVRASS